LIPDGTFAVGRARAVQQYNETRLAVSFHRLEFPDGSTVSLDQYQGLDQAGDVGLHDKVNNHYLATFGRAAAVGILQGLGQRVGSSGFGGNGDNRTVVIEGVGNSTSSAFTTLLNRMPLPTIEIRPGHRLKIYLTSDLELPAWSRTGEVRPVR
jgi:type IV secretion system protein TrbI